MNLADLNKLQSEASSCEARARGLKAQAASLADARRGTATLWDALNSYRTLYTERRDALLRAEALLRDDLLRLAELDLEGQARRLMAEANAKRAAIAAYFGEKAEAKPADEVPA